MEEGVEKSQRFKKSRGGRPPKKVKRSSQLMVRLTETERFLIDSKAKDAGLKPSAWIRQAANKAKVIARLSPGDASVLRMLAGLANNLNQLMRFANMQGLLHDVTRSRKLISDIDDLVQKLRSDDR
ncbi:plasmid mobilization protein [Dyadobacter sandarakinus]|uniref:Mobilisation protein (MobC) n=1 Tax=Dyadobacter sandarakinus TaxID=2747268 RepID=A0ABX7I667_9BACT|nr:hypothetical protein [Dyadobacter sandarakinus]QRR01599.1 hypothetical protein HWI92_12120 [Dyadobacter sandarakinus]